MSAAYRPPPGSIPTLDVPDLSSVTSVHLVGIGGAGMRNLARLLLARGISVSGSDLKWSRGVAELKELGADVHVGHSADQVGSTDAVIVSSAITERNPEVEEARRRGMPVWARAQALAAAARGSRTIAVSGTHGKTTTTSMLAVVLELAGKDPTFVVGGDLNESGSGARAGRGGIFLAEADESDGSFLLMDPEVAILTNVDVDHVDFYRGGRAEIEAAFSEFLSRSRSAVVCIDDAGAMKSLAAASVEATTYGTDPAASFRLEVVSPGPGGSKGVVSAPSGEVRLVLRVDGAHNLENATGALAAAALVGVPPDVAADALSSFGGVKRRFERRGIARGAQFYDDYGHIPAELEVTLQVARRTGPRRLVAVFQPHRYSRTQALWRELGASLVEADVIVVTDVYGAEQDPIPGVTGHLVVDGVRLADPSKRVEYLPHRADVVAFLDEEVRPGDLVVTMGCGDVWTLGDAAMVRIGDRA